MEELREVQEIKLTEVEAVNGEVQDLEQADAIFSEIMNMEETKSEKQFDSPEGKPISFGSASSTA